MSSLSLGGDDAAAPIVVHRLRDVGAEVWAIVIPVAVCIALSVLLVQALGTPPEGRAPPPRSSSVAELVYDEIEGVAAGDGSSKRLGGALLNALVFVGFVAVMTLGLFVCVKKRWQKAIDGFMAFVLVDVYVVILGSVMLALVGLGDWNGGTGTGGRCGSVALCISLHLLHARDGAPPPIHRVIDTTFHGILPRSSSSLSTSPSSPLAVCSAT